jgi:glycosyltransferase involved in cell wall biosynthesis
MRTDVLFLTQNLDGGGSQRQLTVLARGLAARGYAVTVAVFYAGGELQAQLERAGVRVVPLGKRGRWHVAGTVASLKTLVREERPIVTHGYLDVPNLLTLVMRYFEPGTRAVWGVRAAYVDWSRYDFLTRLMFRAACVLSRYADLVIVNSLAGRNHHVALGYPAGKTVVVRNGIDTNLFRPDPNARSELRREWRVGESEVLVGLVARLDPLKGHDTFLRAAAKLAARTDGFRFVCIGGGATQYEQKLRLKAASLGLTERIIWAGSRSDMPAVYNALDIAVSTSSGEGFSNVIGEAMSTGVPCVVTATGDSAAIVGDTGAVIPVGDSDALAGAVTTLAERQSAAARERCRRRIVEHFGLDRLVDETAAVLGLAKGAGRRPATAPRAANAR